MEIYEKIGESNSDFYVTAGAGAGKTTCLKDIYVYFLKKGFSPEKIVAITFTKKAAEEMRSKIFKEIITKKKKEYSRELFFQLEKAFITTIHSFCFSLLKEFGYLLGLNPTFKIIDENEFSHLISETINQVILGFLVKKKESLIRLLVHYPRGIDEYIKQILIYVNTKGISVSKIKKITNKVHKETVIRSRLTKKIHNKVLIKLKNNIEKLSFIKETGQLNEKSKYFETVIIFLKNWLILYNDLLKKEDTLKILLKFKLFLKGNWGKANKLKKNIFNLIKKLIFIEELLSSARLSIDVLNLVEEVEKKIKKVCFNKSCLSFDHLLLQTKKLLLNNKNILFKLRSRWKIFMVDEFQDINSVQNDLIYILTGKMDISKFLSPKPRLIIVGDRKQSIYAFRGADIAIFTKLIKNSLKGKMKVVTLQKNFRSCSGLVKFFNFLFNKIFNIRELKNNKFSSNFGEKDFQIPARNLSGEIFKDDFIEIVKPIKIVDSSKKLNVISRKKLEAEFLADFIINVSLKNKIPLHSIAVLFRKMIRIRIYEEAFFKMGLNFCTVGGQNFYKQQEIIDFFFAMNAILNPKEAQFMIGFLRSPFIGLSDESLLVLVNLEKKRKFTVFEMIMKNISLPSWLGNEQQILWEKAVEIIKNMNPIIRRMMPAEVIEFLLSSTDILPFFMTIPSGKQKIVNLRKLLEIAYNPRGILKGGVENFVKGLALMTGTSFNESENLLKDYTNSVFLMSIHQAKGLEFPIIILPELEFESVKKSKFLRSQKGVFSVKSRNFFTNQLSSTIISETLKEEHRQLESAENARLFYVACTRAKDKLILFQTGYKNFFYKKWFEWIESFVKLNFNDSFDYKRILDPIPTNVIEKKRCSQQKRQIHYLKENRRIKVNLEKKFFKYYLTEEISNKFFKETVSGLLIWFFCPKLYFKIKMFDLSLKSKQELLSLIGSEFDLSTLGVVLHNILEVIDFWSIPVIPNEYFVSLSPGMNKNIEKMLLSLWNSKILDWITRLKYEEISREQEFSFCFPASKNYPEIEIFGKTDLILKRKEKNNFIIIDYKVSKNIDLKRIKDQLAIYALAFWQKSNFVKIPMTYICHFNDSKVNLIKFNFNSKELEAYRIKIIKMVKEINFLLLDPWKFNHLLFETRCNNSKCPLFELQICSIV